jgi:hypothetical protein
MKCPICEKQLKRFLFNNPKEYLFQCSDCSFYIKILNKKTLYIIKEKQVLVNYKKLNTFWANKELEKVKYLINFYRKQINKKQINYNIHFFKKCPVCKKIKFYLKFYKSKDRPKLNTTYQCRLCRKNINKKISVKYNILIRRRYTDIKNINLKKFGMTVNFNFDEFKKWIESNDFKNYYNIFLKNNKSAAYNICVSRKDTTKPYEFDNLKLIFRKDLTQKINVEKQSKNIVQIKNGKIVKIWKSATEASRTQKEFRQSNISKACNGYIKQYKGYQWKFL